MKKLKINFTDFYEVFDKQNNYIYNILSEKYVLIIDEESPTYLFYSCFGQQFLNYNCVRIFYTGENVIPDFNLCYYASGFGYLNFDDRYKSFRNFAAYS